MSETRTTTITITDLHPDLATLTAEAMVLAAREPTDFRPTAKAYREAAEVVTRLAEHPREFQAVRLVAWLAERMG
jgi:hypothetical protein